MTPLACSRIYRKLLKIEKVKMSIREEIIGYLKRHNPAAITESSEPENLKIQRLLDSLQMLDFITFLETNFSIRIEDEDVLSPYFRTVGSIMDMIEVKTKNEKQDIIR